jgi:Glycosyl transferases group 1
MQAIAWANRSVSTKYGLTMSTAFFLAPDSDTPFGGVRKIYHFVDVLNSIGLRAVVVHRRPGFRCSWFRNDTPVCPAEECRPTENDLVTIPEKYVWGLQGVAPGVPKIILNQGAYLTFAGATLLPDATASSPYRDPEVVGTIALSVDSCRYLEHAFPGLAVERIHVGIDPGMYFPEQGNARQITFMPRKRRGDAVQVMNILTNRKVLDGWTVRPIDGMSEREAADIMRRSSIYVSLTYEGGEGFGLPAAEAMASGCLVVGYDGRGGSEFFDSAYCVPTPDGDVLELARQLERVITSWGSGRAEYEAMGRQASRFVHAHYSFEQEAADLERIFSRHLEGSGGSHPSRIDLTTLAPPSKTKSLGRHVVAAVRGLVSGARRKAS